MEDEIVKGGDKGDFMFSAACVCATLVLCFVFLSVAILLQWKG